MTRTRTAAVLTASTFVVAVIAALLVGAAAVWSSLPPRLATHWAPSGTANGSTTRGVLLAEILVAVGLGALALLAAAAGGGRVHRVTPYVGALGAFVMIQLAGIGVVMARQNRNAVSWHAVVGPRVVVAMAPTLIGLIAGGLAAWALARVAPILSPSPPIATQSFTLPEGARAAWVGHCTNRLLLLPAVFVVFAGIAIWLLGGLPAVGLPFAAVGLLTVALASVTVMVDRRGLQVRYGALPWPVTRVPMEDIEAVAAIDVRPSKWGGWGYRGSLRLARKAAVVLRAGPGIRVDLRRGAVFVVTVDDAATGAAVLDTLRHPVLSQ